MSGKTAGVFEVCVEPVNEPVEACLECGVLFADLFFPGRGEPFGDGPSADPGLPNEAAEDDLPEDLQALNLAELREIAKEQGVDLGGATRKADIIAALSA